MTHRSEVSKNEQRGLSWKIFAFRFLAPQWRRAEPSVYIPNLLCGHEPWGATKRTRLQIQAAKLSFTCSVAGLGLRDRARSSDIREVLRAELLLPQNERSSLRWLHIWSPWGGVSDMWSREADPEGAISGLGPPPWAGGSGWGEGFPAKTPTPVTWMSRTRQRQAKCHLFQWCWRAGTHLYSHYDHMGWTVSVNLFILHWWVLL